MKDLYTAKDWLERAQKARATAERVFDPEAKRAALEMAAGYEKLAGMAATGAVSLASVQSIARVSGAP